ncbi:hypothetical protein LUW77_03155 [Streptomyces radiopugnans]|nr:hypothetical protein LUW77_03155 [Streptomyces radiopugnans]
MSAREPLSAEREAEIVARLGYDPIGHLRRAIGDPGTFTPRGDNFTEPVTSWQARAVMAAIGENLFEELDAHAEANHELYTEVKRLRARVAELDSLRSALAVIVKHGDMSETVRQEISDLIAEGGEPA